MEIAPIACKSWQPSHEPHVEEKQELVTVIKQWKEREGRGGGGGRGGETTSQSPPLKHSHSGKMPTQRTPARKPRGPKTHGILAQAQI